MINSKILCLGEMLWDNLADRVGKSISEVDSWTAYPGGAPANVACRLAQLGNSVSFIGCLGKDRAGQKLVQLLESMGVDIRGVQYHDTAPTRQVYVLRTETKERVFAGFPDYRADQFADAFLDPALLSEDLFIDGDFLLLGTLGLAYAQTRKSIFKALQLADRYNLKVVVDLNWRPNFWLDINDAFPLIEKLLSCADFIKMSAEEAQHFYQNTDIKAIAHNLDSAQGIIITNGEGMVNYLINKHQGIVFPPSVEVIDTTGAGDNFVAGFLHQLAKQGMNCLDSPQKIREIITYACYLGSLSVTKEGAISIFEH